MSKESNPGEKINPQEFVFGRELAEVYLLLDNISTMASKNLPDSPKIDNLFDPDKNWLQQICEIGCPPIGNETQHAVNAARLIRVRDMLNRAALPATGATIAFTLLVTGEDAESRRVLDHNEPVSWRRALLGMLGYRRPEKRGATSYQLDRPWQDWGHQPPTRASLASIAFPNLTRSADTFTKRVTTIVVVLVIWLLFTCALSWYVAEGTALLNDFNLARADVSTTTTQILFEAPPSPPLATGATTTPAVLGPLPPLDLQSVKQIYESHCEASPATSPPLAPHLRTCAALSDAMARQQRAQLAINNWHNPWFWRYLRMPQFGGSSPSESQAISTPVPTDPVWASTWLAIVGGVILPVFYGVIGAGAAVVRNLSAKVRDSLLAPRDALLSYIRLALGAVIGGCIGLFVTPNGSGDSSGLLSVTHLSASALCFVAGFSVEGVFQALESLTGRVFGTKNSTPS